MRKGSIKNLIAFLTGFFVISCGDAELGNFQQNAPEPQVKLFEIFDNTPALKSMFNNIDPYDFNQKLNDIIQSNPELVTEVMKLSADTFYGDEKEIVLPKATRDLSDSFYHFHETYNKNDKTKESFDTSTDVISSLLSLDADAMTGGANALINTLKLIRNTNIIGENLDFSGAHVTGKLSSIPVLKGSISIEVDGQNIDIKDNKNGKIIGSDVIATGTINYTTGNIEFTLRDVLPMENVTCAYSNIRREGANNWDLLGPGQELADIGQEGTENLIDNLTFVQDLFEEAPDIDDFPAYVNNFLNTLATGDKDVEEWVDELIEMLSKPDDDPESVWAIEKDIADWLVADSDKMLITDYLINELYPMIKNPEITGKKDIDGDGEKEETKYNFIEEGKKVLDGTATLFSSSPKSISEENYNTSFSKSIVSNDKTLLTQWFVDSLYKDIDYYDHLEDVDVFDFKKNELLKWLKDDLTYTLNSSLSLPGSPNGIKKERVKDILWDGWTYDPTGPGSNSIFKGILYVDPSNNYNNHGPVAKMAATRSADEINKPIRMQIHDIINGNNNGDYTDDGDPLDENVFKKLNLNYANSNEDGNAESQIESIVNNIYLDLLSYYYSPTEKKWALNPGDGKKYFNAPNRNLQSLIGGIQTSLRNLLVLDKNGIEAKDGGGSIPMITELLYVLAAGYGVVDPINGPGELSVQNCLKSMGSVLGNQTHITSDVGLFSIDINVLGNNDIFRKSTNGGNWVGYATQHQMPANELLQPGTFRERWNNANHGSKWHGKFAASQGDVIGISNDDGDIITTNWTLSEIALSCWEGYGPYTYKGKAPNGSDCKYKNSWNSDWYYMKGTWNGNKGPGFGKLNRGQGRYHVYEAIYRPQDGNPGFSDSGFEDRNGNPVPKYGYIRPNKNDGSYSNTNKVVNYNKKVTLDCASRGEAMRKNFKWLINQKKYMYMIPIHASKKVGWWVFSADIEIYAYTTINGNGIAGISNAKRYGHNISDNAKWGLTGINSNYKQYYEDKDNYFLNVVDEGNNTSRFSGVSFDDGDYTVAMDYKYYVSGMFKGLAKAMVDMTNEIWKCLGDNPVLPVVIGNNFTSMIQIGNAVYTTDDIISNGYNSNENDIRKFGKFYDLLYSDADLLTNYENGTITAEELPPVPKVKGVTYPVEFSEDGSVSTWEEYTNSNEGKFEQFLGLFSMIVGTIHEDGTVYKDINGTNPVTSQDEIDNGQVAYYAKDGFRAQMDNFVLTTVGLNETYRNGSHISNPSYNTNAITNILVDYNPKKDRTEPGSRKGLMNVIAKSKFLNINYFRSVTDGINQAVRNIIRTYLNNNGLFNLTNGGGDEDLSSYYLKNDDGEYIIGDDGFRVRNPEIDWDKPINKLRYFTDDKALDQIEKGLNMVVDLSKDQRFTRFIKKTIPAMNNYLIVKYIEKIHKDEDRVIKRDEAIAEGVFQISLTDEDIDKIIDFLSSEDENGDVWHKKFFDFIKDTGLNDIEKFYNFDANEWLETMNPGKMQENMDELNTKMIKFFDMNVKEGIIDGMYKIKKDAYDVPTGFKPGEIVYGLGKYIAADENDPDAFESNGKYFRYIDIATYIDDEKEKDEGNSQIEIQFEGLRALIGFRHDSRSDQDYSENCEDYKDKWYRGGLEECPNIYNLHKYDIRMDWAMDNYNETLLNMTAADFTPGQTTRADLRETFGKGDSKVYHISDKLIDFLYGWNGSTYKGIEVDTILNYTKDKVVDKIYDDTPIELSDDMIDLIELNELDYMNIEDKTVSVRTLAGRITDQLMDNLFEYEYLPGQFESYEINETNGTHKHMMNNMTEMLAALLNPDSKYYQTENLYNAWKNFNEAANIEPDELVAVTEVVSSLLYDNAPFTDLNSNGLWDEGEPYKDNNNNGIYDEEDKYTRMFTKMTSHAPAMMKAYKGRYSELLELGLTATDRGGIGEYLMTVMEVDEQYSSWDVANEMNFLLQQDIFREYTYEDTFWWQMGLLLDDLAVIIEEQLVLTDVDFADELSSIFK